VRFTVADTGTGMEPGVRERIFEAFFTTKDVTGTGLGLWVSQEIIVKHHGLVHVVSRTEKPGRPSGTVFQIFLPDDLSLAAESAQTAAAAVWTVCIDFLTRCRGCAAHDYWHARRSSFLAKGRLFGHCGGKR
jgi:hypothetical protein